MPKPNNSKPKNTNIKVRDISGVEGDVNIAGGNITTHKTTSGFNEAQMEQLFDRLYAFIDVHASSSPTNKEDMNAEVQGIQSALTDAAQKHEPLDEGLLSRHFRNIARIAPDVLDVVVATLGNPLAGLGVAAKKIAGKAKEEAK